MTLEWQTTWLRCHFLSNFRNVGHYNQHRDGSRPWAKGGSGFSSLALPAFLTSAILFTQNKGGGAPRSATTTTVFFITFLSTHSYSKDQSTRLIAKSSFKPTTIITTVSPSCFNKVCNVPDRAPPWPHQEGEGTRRCFKPEPQRWFSDWISFILHRSRRNSCRPSSLDSRSVSRWPSRTIWTIYSESPISTPIETEAVTERRSYFSH